MLLSLCLQRLPPVNLSRLPMSLMMLWHIVYLQRLLLSVLFNYFLLLPSICNVHLLGSEAIIRAQVVCFDSFIIHCERLKVTTYVPWLPTELNRQFVVILHMYFE